VVAATEHVEIVCPPPIPDISVPVEQPVKALDSLSALHGLLVVYDSGMQWTANETLYTCKFVGANGATAARYLEGHIIVAHENGGIRTYNAVPKANGEHESERLNCEDIPPSFSPKSRPLRLELQEDLLAVLGQAGTFEVFDLRSGASRSPAFSAGTIWQDASISGDLLVATTGEPQIAIHEFFRSTGTPLPWQATTTKAQIVELAPSPQSGRVAACHDDGQLVLENKDGSETRCTGVSVLDLTDLPGLTDDIRHILPFCAMAWSPDGHVLATTTQARHVQLWSVDVDSCRATERRNIDHVSSLSWSAAGELLASSAIAAWDPTGTRLASFASEEMAIRIGGNRIAIDKRLRHDEALSLTWSASGRHLALLLNSAVVLVDIERRVARIREDHGRLQAMRWHPTDDRLALVRSDGVVMVVDGEHGDVSARFETQMINLTTVLWLDGGAKLAIVGGGREVPVAYSYHTLIEIQTQLAEYIKARSYGVVQ